MDALTQGLLSNEHEVKVLTISTHKHPFQEDQMSEEYRKQTKIEHRMVDTRVKAWDAFLNLFSSSSYNVQRFISKDFASLIEKTLHDNNYDIILLESLYVVPYFSIIKPLTRAKIVYRAHNIEHEIWSRHVKRKFPKLKDLYNYYLAGKLKRYELSILNQFDAIAAISDRDKQSLKELGCNISVEVFPFGVEVSDYAVNPTHQALNFFHIGSMDWQPNLDGVFWFSNDPWFRIYREFPEVSFHIAGRKMPNWFKDFKEANQFVHGEVESALQFMVEHDVMVVPLFAGSGMRIKIVEAMAMGKVVIGTKIAFEGIDVIHGEHALIANNEEEFVQTAGRCILGEINLLEMGQKARALIENNYDNQRIVNNLVTFIKQL